MFLTSVLKDFIFIGAKQNQHNKNCHKLSDRSLLLFPLSRSLILFFSSHLLLSVHLFLVEPHYPCYLRQLSLSGCVLLTSHTGSCVGWLGEGRSRERREEVDGKAAQWRCGGVSTYGGQGQFSTTHCFVIVPMVFCPQWSAGKAARRG